MWGFVWDFEKKGRSAPSISSMQRSQYPERERERARAREREGERRVVDLSTIANADNGALNACTRQDHAEQLMKLPHVSGS